MISYVNKSSKLTLSGRGVSLFMVFSVTCVIVLYLPYFEAYASLTTPSLVSPHDTWCLSTLTNILA
jgi:hypothetical protein